MTKNEGRMYFGGGGVNIRFGAESGNYETTYSDHQGSPLMGTDALGTVKWRENYTPFG